MVFPCAQQAHASDAQCRAALGASLKNGDAMGCNAQCAVFDTGSLQQIDRAGILIAKLNSLLLAGMVEHKQQARIALAA